MQANKCYIDPPQLVIRVIHEEASIGESSAVLVPLDPTFAL